MKEQENVYDDTTRAEDTTAVSKEELASTIPSKFKDVDALVRAYSSLQAEFTRRSQRLKELEKKAENLETEEGVKADSGVEKLRKNALLHKEENQQFTDFVAETLQKNRSSTKDGASDFTPDSIEVQPSKEEDLQDDSTQNGDTMVEMNDLQKAEELENRGKKGMEAVSASMRNVGEEERENRPEREETAESFETLYERASKNEQVRLRIIGEYLSSLGKPSVSLMAGSMGVLTTPPKRAKDIRDAGNMALMYFKKPKA